jgi:hypothetical protein
MGSVCGALLVPGRVADPPIRIGRARIASERHHQDERPFRREERPGRFRGGIVCWEGTVYPGFNGMTMGSGA